MRPIDHSSLSPDERRSEVASILAAGVLRLCARMLPSTESDGYSAPENPSESGAPCLEVLGETVLSVHNG